jgi:ligand-binding sensor domain-containing protein
MLSTAVPRWNVAAVYLCWLLAVGCFTSTALAQYRFDSWTADTGLPQYIIVDIHQTRDGYLWLATLDGLARFDGVRFTVFKKGNRPGLHSNRFTSRLHEDRQGDLWVGTEDGYVTRYSRAHFTSFATAHGLIVRGFTEDGEGHLYCLAEQRLWRWQPTPGGEPAAGHFSEVATPSLLGGLGLLGWTGRGSRPWRKSRRGLSGW